MRPAKLRLGSTSAGAKGVAAELGLGRRQCPLGRPGMRRLSGVESVVCPVWLHWAEQAAAWDLPVGSIKSVSASAIAVAAEPGHSAVGGASRHGLGSHLAAWTYVPVLGMGEWSLCLAAFCRVDRRAGVLRASITVEHCMWESSDSSEGRALSSSSELPNFFASTKFFACLDLMESQELFESTQMARPPCLPPAAPMSTALLTPPRPPLRTQGSHHVCSRDWPG